VHEAIEDGVSEGWLVDNVMPCLDWQLAGDQRRAGAVAVFNNFHEVAPLVGREPIRSPVIEDQQIGPGEGAEQACEAAVTVRQFEVGEQSRHARIMHGVAVTAGFLCERTTEP